MPLLRRLRSASFRLTLFTAPLYMVAGWVLLAFVFFNTRAIMEHRVDLGLSAESRRLTDDLAGADRDAAVEAIRARIVSERGSARLYHIESRDGAAPVDNFILVDGVLPEPGAYADVTMRRGADDASHRARLLGMALPRASTLVLGRDLTEEDQFGDVVRDTLSIGAALMAVLALLAGALTSRAVMRRLAGFNAAAQRVLHGHLDERMPLAGSDDEFDHLAGNLNEALDRIAELMATTRHVTDDIAHDLRSPLSRVRGRLEYLQISLPPIEEMEPALAECVADLDQILETFESLLSIARLEYGVPPDLVAIDLVAMARDLVDYFLPLAEEKQQTLTLETGDRLVAAADRHLLFQALSNILDNAVRYTPCGGRIVVSLREQAGQGVIRIADDGPGIPADQRRRVVERFVRLDGSRHLRGTGLGLAVVDAVVRHHRGELAFADARPGLEVTITLPRASGGDIAPT